MQTTHNQYLSHEATQGHSCLTLFIQPYYEGTKNFKKAKDQLIELINALNRHVEIQTANKCFKIFNNLANSIKFIGLGVLLWIPIINTISLIGLRVFNQVRESGNLINPGSHEILSDFYPILEKKASLQSLLENPSLSDPALLEKPSFTDPASLKEPSFTDRLEKRSFPYFTEIINNAKKISLENNKNIKIVIWSIIEKLDLNQFKNLENVGEKRVKRILTKKIISFLQNPSRILAEARSIAQAENTTIMSVVLKIINEFKLSELEKEELKILSFSSIFELSEIAKKELEKNIFLAIIEEKLKSAPIYPKSQQKVENISLMEHLRKEINVFTEDPDQRKSFEDKILKTYLKKFLKIFIHPYINSLKDPFEKNRVSLTKILEEKIRFFDESVKFSRVQKKMLEIYLKKQLDFVEIWNQGSIETIDKSRLINIKNKIERVLYIDFPDIMKGNAFDYYKIRMLNAHLETRCGILPTDLEVLDEKLKKIDPNQKQYLNEINKKIEKTKGVFLKTIIRSIKLDSIMNSSNNLFISDNNLIRLLDVLKNDEIRRVFNIKYQNISLNRYEKYLRC